MSFGKGKISERIKSSVAASDLRVKKEGLNRESIGALMVVNYCVMVHLWHCG